MGLRQNSSKVSYIQFWTGSVKDGNSKARISWRFIYSINSYMYTIYVKREMFTRLPVPVQQKGYFHRPRCCIGRRSDGKGQGLEC
jgi:hypothetical protein